MSDQIPDDPAGREHFSTLTFDNVGRDSLPVESETSPPGRPASRGIVEFNQDCYLEAYPDLAGAIETGQFTSARAHYLHSGRSANWLSQESYLKLLAGGVSQRAAHGAMSFSIDVAIASHTGTLFVVGWTDDRETPLISVSAIQGSEGWNTRGIVRCRRADVEQVLQSPIGHSYGFWLVHELGQFDAQGVIMLRARFADGRFTQLELKPRVVSDVDLRETALGHFSSLQYLGNREIESAQQLESGVGNELVALNRSISRALTAAAHVERYGPTRARFDASFIVCLFGKHEYFFLQNALFAPGADTENVEFVYVSNSPELTEALQKEAQIAERIYGISLTLVTLPGNAGFSAANNVAAKFARSERLVFINPDVFPRDDGWARLHREIIETKPPAQTKLFGGLLYYDDGSLMHGGMYFEIDRGLSVKPTEIQGRNLIRVEHYGKGAPDWSTRYTQERPVPAVTGAFISADRNWFELLGGFTEDYLFGHYEDADLCLKSLQNGGPAWIHDIRFWHLEGKGSVRRPPHEGGSLVNRWLFTRNWGKTIEDSLVGRAPSHPLLDSESDGTFTTPAPMAAADDGLSVSAQLISQATPNPELTVTR